MGGSSQTNRYDGTLASMPDKPRGDPQVDRRASGRPRLLAGTPACARPRPVRCRGADYIVPDDEPLPLPPLEPPLLLLPPSLLLLPSVVPLPESPLEPPLLSRPEPDESLPVVQPTSLDLVEEEVGQAVAGDRRAERDGVFHAVGEVADVERDRRVALEAGVEVGHHEHHGVVDLRHEHVAAGATGVVDREAEREVCGLAIDGDRLADGGLLECAVRAAVPGVPVTRIGAGARVLGARGVADRRVEVGRGLRPRGTRGSAFEAAVDDDVAAALPDRPIRGRPRGVVTAVGRGHLSAGVRGREGVGGLRVARGRRCRRCHRSSHRS
ncbi:MAG: hypothetical protein IPN32_14000 [Deltaproteobacteria bacterium]|nr:hypothetical protein [Deltaproteobacteria bacterium]